MELEPPQRWGDSPSVRGHMSYRDPVSETKAGKEARGLQKPTPETEYLLSWESPSA